MRTLFGFLWAGWAAAFAVLESAAFLLHRSDLTLSDYTWRFEGSGWTAARYFVAAVMVWAALHLTLGLFRS